MNQLQTILDALESGKTYDESAYKFDRIAKAINIVKGMMQAEPVAWFVFGDSNGPVPLEVYGWDEKACKNALLTNARSVCWKGTLEGYLYKLGLTIEPVYTHPAPQAVSAWLPIESAPQNTAVDLWCRSQNNQEYGKRVTSVCLAGNDWYGGNLPNPKFGEYASHWMPLPAAPAVKGVV